MRNVSVSESMITAERFSDSLGQIEPWESHVGLLTVQDLSSNVDNRLFEEDMAKQAVKVTKRPEVRVREKVVKEFVGQCPVCGKELTALTEKRLDYTILLHQKFSHPAEYAVTLQQKKKQAAKDFFGIPRD